MKRYPGPAPDLGDILRIVDIRTKIVSVSSLLVGSAWALATAPERFSWGLFATMAAATLLVDMGTTGFNSYFDFVSGVDTRETDQERFKALVQRGIDPRSRCISPSPSTRRPSRSGSPSARAPAGAWSPSGPPACSSRISIPADRTPISRTPVGEFFAGGLLGGALIVVAAYVHTQRVDAPTILVGVPSSLVIAGILSTNNACDRVGDERAGRRTLAIVLGPDRSHWPVYALVAAAFAAVAPLAALRVLPPWAFLPMVLPRGARLAHPRGHEHARLVARDQGAEHGRHLARVHRLHRVPAREHRAGRESRLELAG